MSYTLLDLEVGRVLPLDDSFSLRFFGGARLAWNDLAVKCIYSGGTLGDSSDFINSRARFQGAGLTAGAQGNWDLFRGWGLFAGGQFSLLPGQFRTSRTETIGPAVAGSVTDSFATIVPIVELMVGLHYQGKHLSFSAGYEMTNWLNMVTGLAPSAGSTALANHQVGNLTLKLLIAKLGFTF